MDRQTKIILIVSGAVVVATGLGFGIYYLIKQPSKDNQTGGDTNPYLKTESLAETEAPTHTGIGYQPLIAPTFNSENELSNSIAQLRGKYLYPKTKGEGGWDYANVRSSAEVNTDQGWWDTGNKITTIYKGNRIGKVLSDTASVLNDYSYRWFRVLLSNPTSGYSEGFVRADTVTFKPIY